MKVIFTTILSVFLFSVNSFSQIALPFVEDFSNGLSANNWTVDANNWRVSANMGNPAPSVIFYGNITNYNLSLTSDYLNGTTYVSGVITFNFDMALSNINATGTELLTVEVDNGSGWVQIAEYSNINGGISWGTQTYDITNLVMGTNFKIRFRSHGQNAANNNSWMIDNVEVFISPVKAQDVQQLYARIYPNPATGNSVKFELTPGFDKLIIYDLVGNVRYSEKINPTEPSLSIDITRLVNGIYPVKFITPSGKSIATKLVITR